MVAVIAEVCLSHGGPWSLILDPGGSTPTTIVPGQRPNRQHPQFDEVTGRANGRNSGRSWRPGIESSLALDGTWPQNCTNKAVAWWSNQLADCSNYGQRNMDGSMVRNMTRIVVP